MGLANAIDTEEVHPSSNGCRYLMLAIHNCPLLWRTDLGWQEPPCPVMPFTLCLAPIWRLPIASAWTLQRYKSSAPSPHAQQPESCNAPSTALHGIRWTLNFSWDIFAKLLLLLSRPASLGPLEIFFLLRAFPQKSFTQESLPQAHLH